MTTAIPIHSTHTKMPPAKIATDIATGISAGVVLQTMTQQLAQAGCPSPRLDARLLLQHAWASVYARGYARGYARDYAYDLMLDEAVLAECAALLARRLAGEPISRMRGTREFWSLEFALSPQCLDPRPDSETLVAAAIEILKKTTSSQQPLIIDYGTGSGCLLVAILSEIPHARGIGLDCASTAIATATKNAEALGVGGRTRMLVSNWCDELDKADTKADIKADMIIANPPYIASDDIARLSPEVRLYDPPLALDGGADGLEAMRAILPRIKKRLNGNGTALVEIGVGQKSAVVGLAKQHGLQCMGEWCDLAGTIRVLGFNA